MRRIWRLALIIWTLFLAHEVDAVNVYGDITMWDGFKDYPDTEGERGYAIRRFKIQNRSTDKTRRVTLRLPYDKMSGKLADVRLHSISKTIEMAPSSIECVTLFQPALPLYGDGCAVYIDGKRQQEPVEPIARLADHGTVFSSAPSSAAGSLIGSSAPFEPKIFMTNINLRFHEAYMGGKAAEFLSRAGASGGKSFSTPQFISANEFDIRFRRAFKVDETDVRHSNHFGPSWLNYSSVEGVVYDDGYVAYMTGPARLALWRYVECGGTLTFIAIPDKVEVYDGTLRYSSRKLLSEWASLDSRLKNRRIYEDTYERFDVGFGVFHLVGQNSFGSGDIADTGIAIPETWYEAEPARNQLHTAYGANQVLPMAEPVDSRASYRRFFFLMLILAALIGPANLYLLKRMKRREWVYWTTPAVSILACGAFVLYASVAFGWHQQTRVVSLTHLDQISGRAATIGWAAYYSPLKTAAELRFDENTELTPLAFGGNLVGSIDWTDGQRLTGGWLPARVPRHFKLRKNEDRPERIDLKKEGGNIGIVNRLGSRVKALWYADHDGKVYQAADIPNGSESVLTETNGVKIGLKKLRDVYASQDWVAEIKTVKASPAAYLQPGQYFAELKESAFVEKALEGAKAKPSISLVIGQMEEEK